MAIRIERPAWFRGSTDRPRSATTVEILPELVAGYAQKGWLGDESSGVSVAELEEKIKKKRRLAKSKNGFEIIDVSQLSAEEFTFRLEQIRQRQPKRR